MGPLRLLLTADTIGGVWTYAIELVEALAPWGCEVLLATLGGALSPSQSRAVAHIPGLTVCESSYKLEWMDDPWADVDASGAWLMELAATFQPHLIHLNTFAHGALPWDVPVLMVGHSCVLSWWQAVKEESAPPYWATYRQRVQAGLQSADLVVAPTHAMLDALETHYGPLRATQVIYNARRPASFAHGNKESFIFAMGRLWDEAKNISILEQVAPKLPWPVYIAGEQRHPNGGQLDVAHLHALGHLDQPAIRNWLARASIYAFPARYEPFGLSVLEAALSGCTLVLGDIASLREVWGATALYVPPNDVDALAEVLSDLIAQPRQREALGLAARARAVRYAPATMGEAYWQAYTKLLELTDAKSELYTKPVSGSVLPSIPVRRGEQNPISTSGLRFLRKESGDEHQPYDQRSH
jgi:glycogen synthase